MTTCAAAMSSSCLCVIRTGFKQGCNRHLQAGLPGRASEIFDWLRGLPSSHPLASLCDVYTYTTIIAQVQLPQIVTAPSGCTVADALLIPGAGALLRRTCSPMLWPSCHFNRASLIPLVPECAVWRGAGAGRGSGTSGGDARPRHLPQLPRLLRPHER